MAHALFAPSAAKRWLACPGSIALSQGIEDTGSAFAREGTAAHELASLSLLTGDPAASFIGRESEDAPGVVFTEDMAFHVQSYVDHVKEQAATAVDLMVEQKVDMSGHVPECWGTSDVVILRETEIHCVDLKFGRGVRVDAEHNEQLMLYALGAYTAFAAVLDTVETVRMTIHQPRLEHVSEWSCSVQDLLDFARTAADAAARAKAALADPRVAEASLNPGEDQCRFCPAKAKCPALLSAVESAMGVSIAAAFEDLDKPPAAPHARLALQMAKVGMVEDWCKAVRAECERVLLAGDEVPGWKLVQGRQGPRRWSDPDAVEGYLKNVMRLKNEVAYDMTLISPTTAEKLVKQGVIGPRRWSHIEQWVTRTEGSLSVAPASDKRPAVTVATAAEAFQSLETQPLPL